MLSDKIPLANLVGFIKGWKQQQIVSLQVLAALLKIPQFGYNKQKSTQTFADCKDFQTLNVTLKHVE